MSEIFLFNIFVSHIRLHSNIVNDAGETIFLVKIYFKNLPTIIIRDNCLRGKILPVDNFYEFIFNAGEFQYFAKKINELITILKEYPLKIGIYREGDSFPLCQVEIPFFGCACSLISSDSKKNLSKNFTIDGEFNLLDPGENPSGKISIKATLVNCGRSVSSYYRPQAQSFIIKKYHLGTEYEFFQVSNNNSKIISQKLSEINLSSNYQQFYDNFIKNLIIISPSSRYLSKEEKSTKTAHISNDRGKKKKSTKKKQKKNK
ncbi:uncharacterized protein LOC127289810 [Leptopilina boulardi]|uniref:uncharacterized protein LOC127289810 n=1 Tax=Leptopilina boulardi TaxID=63433 RepID=UPI0021F545AE|nr:uncharacterized protein LOC127289810 [Leptopilina boulardi]